jgi:fibronectin type 3 domain-containing protein
VLSWQTVPQGSAFFRIARKWISAPEEGHSSPLTSHPPVADQMLVVHPASGSDPGHAIDNSALSNQKYRYVLQRVATTELSGKTIEVQGLPSEPVEITTTDRFPPAVPQGLAAVADTAAGAIDLSWSPNSDADLAGYRVYRRDVQGNLPAQQIASPGMESSYRDTSVQPGHTYAYAVSALDQIHNESKPSPEVEETLSPP